MIVGATVNFPCDSVLSVISVVNVFASEPRNSRKTPKRSEMGYAVPAFALHLVSIGQSLVHRYFIDVFEVAADGHAHGDAGYADAERL